MEWKLPLKMGKQKSGEISESHSPTKQTKQNKQTEIDIDRQVDADL